MGELDTGYTLTFSEGLARRAGVKEITSSFGPVFDPENMREDIRQEYGEFIRPGDSVRVVSEGGRECTFEYVAPSAMLGRFSICGFGMTAVRSLDDPEDVDVYLFGPHMGDDALVCTLTGAGTREEYTSEIFSELMYWSGDNPDLAAEWELSMGHGYVRGRTYFTERDRTRQYTVSVNDVNDALKVGPSPVRAQSAFTAVYDYLLAAPESFWADARRGDLVQSVSVGAPYGFSLRLAGESGTIANGRKVFGRMVRGTLAGGTFMDVTEEGASDPLCRISVLMPLPVSERIIGKAFDRRDA